MVKKQISDSTQDFQVALLNWFSKYQRSMPWRGIQDPYRIWVSEVMLQQTQVKKVKEYYQNFIKRFPDIKQLADAPLQDVLKVWEGLGYYARARNLHKAAKVVIQEYGGEIPRNYDTFRKLPGIGDYTASAVLSIAYDYPHAAVDGNIKRVLSRLFLMKHPINDASSLKAFKENAETILDTDNPGLFNQAMMELGATVCRPQSPTCLVCPINMYCKSFHTGRQSEFPYRLKREAIPEQKIATGVIYKGSEVLIVQKPLDGLLGGLWEFPNGQIGEKETAENACIRHISDVVNLSVTNMNYLTRVRHAFTHFKIVVDVFYCDYQSGEVVLNGPIDSKWVKLSELRDYPLPRVTHKFLNKLIV